MSIPFNVPPVLGTEAAYLAEVLESRNLTGDGPFVKRCRTWFEQRLGCRAALLTGSCTHALETAALLADVGPGDEVIMPSFTFVSTANPFVLRGARIVFVDVRPDTMNLDERLIEAALTDRTRAIVPMHYAGVACAMDELQALADARGLAVIEDAAQGVLCRYRGRPLGTLSAAGSFSFHATKNISAGEGGLLAVNEPAWVERAEILREKGTNRQQFFRGQVDKYTWVDLGSSFVFDELRAAVLWAQLERADDIIADRLRSWRRYAAGLAGLVAAGRVEVQTVPAECEHNGHIFYIKCADLDERTRLVEHLKAAGISAVFHYVPLHSAPAGRKFGRFVGEDRYTTRDSERLLRLPLYYDMGDDAVDRVIEQVEAFYNRGR